MPEPAAQCCRLCAVRGRPQPPLQEHGRSLWIGILDLYTLPRRVGQRRALELTLSCRPIGTRAARDMGFLDDAFGEDTAAGEAPRPGSGIPRDASEEAREASRRRIRQAPRELSRQRAGTDAGQFLRTRSLLSRGPPAL